MFSTVRTPVKSLILVDKLIICFSYNRVLKSVNRRKRKRERERAKHEGQYKEENMNRISINATHRIRLLIYFNVFVTVICTLNYTEVEFVTKWQRN